MELPIEAARQIAAEHGLTLCDHCEQPREQHFGFDHGKGRCILCAGWIDMSFLYPKEAERLDAMNRINAYNEAHGVAEYAWANQGEGI